MVISHVNLTNSEGRIKKTRGEEGSLLKKNPARRERGRERRAYPRKREQNIEREIKNQGGEKEGERDDHTAKERERERYT